MEVVVYILTGDTNSPRTHHVKGLFDNPLFIVNVVTVDDPVKLVVSDKITREESLEHYRISWCLEDAKKFNPDNPTIIVKDTSVSNSSPDTIAEIVSTALASNTWDICYLCKWLDRCDLYTDKITIPGRTTIIAKTQTPQGTQAILLTPKARDYLESYVKDHLIEQSYSSMLQQQILTAKLNATCVVPNLLEYDITAAKSDLDYLKTYQCDSKSNRIVVDPTQSSGSSFGWLIFLILILLVILGIYWIYKNKSSY